LCPGRGNIPYQKGEGGHSTSLLEIEALCSGRGKRPCQWRGGESKKSVKKIAGKKKAGRSFCTEKTKSFKKNFTKKKGAWTKKRVKAVEFASPNSLAKKPQPEKGKRKLYNKKDRMTSSPRKTTTIVFVAGGKGGGRKKKQ